MATSEKTNTYKPTFVRDTTNSTALGTGALIVLGGASIAKQMFVGELLTLNNNISNTTASFSITGGTMSFTIQPAAAGIDLTLAPSGIGRVLLNANPTSALHAATKNYVDASRIYSISFATGALDHVSVNSTAVYTNVANFIWRGSTEFGIPNKAFIYAWCANTQATRFIRWRIFDLTNSLVICTTAITNSSARTVIDMGVVSNIPIGPAVFTLQQQDTDAAGNPNTHATNGNVSSVFFYRN